MHLVQRAAASASMTPDDLLNAVVEQWIAKHDNLGLVGDRKAQAMAVAYLVSTSSQAVLSRMTELVSIWVGSLADSEEEASSETLYDTELALDADEQDTTESIRRSKVRSSCLVD